MKLLTLTLATIISLFACSKNETVEENIPEKVTDFRQKMREFVIGISKYSKAKKVNFMVIPQNGIELISSNGYVSGKLQTDYLNAIDGNGQEDLFYGYDDDDKATSTASNVYLKGLLDMSKNSGKTILVTDYCSSPPKMANSYIENERKGYISFAANERGLNNIPKFPNSIHQENSATITKLSEVKNFLYLINPEKYTSKSAFIAAITATNYDLLLMDVFFNGNSIFTESEINQLKNKVNGGKRLVIAYMSIGEAEVYRYYWQPNWLTNKPAWLDAENPDWAGNYKVKYWNPAWQKIIYGNDNSYLQKILNANFDGVYLDIIDAFEFYEK